MSDQASNVPRARITLDGKDLSPLIDPRLVSLRLQEKRGDEADQLDIVLSDTDGKLALPSPGAVLRLELGWERGDNVSVGLIDKGSFKVDAIGHSGPPDAVTIRARSADFTSKIRGRRDQSWRGKSLGQIIRDVAGRNGLKAHIDQALGGKVLKILTQSRESDIALLKRLGKEHDAVATVKDGKLIFAQIGKGTTASGASIPRLTIRRRDGDKHSYDIEKRDEYTGVTAKWRDAKGAKRNKVTVGGDDNAKALKRVYPSEAEARRAAQAERGRIQRATAKMTLTLAYGRADLYPERKAKVQGFKADIDGTDWLITEVTHEMSKRGLTSQLQLETAA
ncbi:contractile injection system protein, VgrG/Pvc8 family [Sphingomonas cavernae]|uniref:Phage late control D family protein n=1 Tax=Sphingomonas cavernae TaxID=2320861 RepID=A0A418WP31_9SPHN|nr:contractile injection system protein, VgrG/Pvc8 family [Sphingomonas cavernae]RJF92998.1 phage late control D family protein [Sphingomonas cavernae]